MRKRQITATIDKNLVEEFERVRDETGLPVSKQIEIALKGYKVVKEGK